VIPEVIDLLCSEFHRVPNRIIKDTNLYPRAEPKPEDNFPTRQPIVTILGHVNHGKTTLLDALRNDRKKVVDTEAGGITQHMGAFECLIEKNKKVAVLDTPGHAAFEALRERGAKLCDVAILVVDASRGVQDQTITCIRYLRESKMEIVVALNKVDKKTAKIAQTKKEIEATGLHLEEFGGTIPVVPISALTGKGIEELKATIATQCGLLHLIADDEGPAEVVILESRIDKSKGIVSSGIVKCGKFKKGDLFIVENTIAKVKRIYNTEGKIIPFAVPGQVIEFNGYEGKEELPNAGAYLIVTDEHKARAALIYRTRKEQEVFRNASILENQEKRIEDEELLNLDKLYALENGFVVEEYVEQKKAERESQKPKDVPILLKGDVTGSIEAVNIQIKQFPSDQLNVYVVKQGVGDVSDNDLRVASTTAPAHCVVIAFNVNVTPKAKTILNTATNITIKSFQIIHHLMDWLAEYCSSLLPPVIIYKDTAVAEVKQKFDMKKRGDPIHIAGCLVTSGTMSRGSDVQVRRNGEILFTGKIRQLRHLKDEVAQIQSGKECGILFTSNFGDFQAGDEVVAVESVKEKVKFKVNEYKSPGNSNRS
jgi:translation initiation factor IF-2